MHKIKEMLMNELYEYEEKAKKMSGGKLSMQELEKIHKLTDTVKNIDKIEMLEEDGEYSGDTDFMGEGRMYGTSYARGRGRNARRDSMGRYSREGSSYEGGMSNRGGSSYDDGMAFEGGSYARGGQGGNRGGRGGNMGGRGGYSRDGAKEHMIEKIEDMMEDAESPKEKEALKRCMMALENA